MACHFTSQSLTLYIAGEWSIICSSHLLTTSSMLPVFRLLWRKQLWTLLFLCGCPFSFLLGEYVEADSRSYGKCIFNFMRNWQRVLQEWLYHFAFLSAVYEGLSYVISLSTFDTAHLQKLWLLWGCRVITFCDFICTSIMIDNGCSPPWVYLPLVYLLRWSVCLNLLPIYKSRLSLSYYCFVNSLQILIHLVLISFW